MEKGYINGSDLLLKVAGKAVGHCSSHTLTFNSETKDRAVKPVASAAKAAVCGKRRVLRLFLYLSASRVYASTMRRRAVTSRLPPAGVKARAWRLRLLSVATTQHLM